MTFDGRVNAKWLEGKTFQDLVDSLIENGKYVSENMSLLDTKDKDSLISAINEINAKKYLYSEDIPSTVQAIDPTKIVNMKNSITGEVEYPKTIKSALFNDDGTPLSLNNSSNNGIVIRVNTVEITTQWVGIPSETDYAIQYIPLPSINNDSNVLVSPTAGAFAYEGTDKQVAITGNIKEYIDCGVHCSWAGVGTDGKGQLMFSCSKITTKKVYVDVMELINIGTTTGQEQNLPSSNNHYHNITAIQGMEEYKALMDSKVTDFELKANTAYEDIVQKLSSYNIEAITADVQKAKTEIGDVNSLLTTEKATLTGAINEVFLSGSSFKNDIAAAITAKGVPTLVTDSKETFVTNIGALQGESEPLKRPLIFEVTTVNTNTTFEFPAYAPYNLKVDWGDLSAISEAEASGDGRNSILHTYALPGTYTIKVSGICRKFSYENITNRVLIKKIVQIGDVSNYMANSFRYCGGINDISSVVLDNPNIYDASYMFSDCPLITSIPASIFTNSNIIIISSMFFNCIGLTSLPAFLFKGVSLANTDSAFAGCLNITSLPADLFNGCVNFNVSSSTWLGISTNRVTMIDENMLRGYLGKQCDNMFKHFTNLISVPAKLFANTNIKSFVGTFSNCTGLTFFPSHLFSGINIENANFIFSNCTGITALTADFLNGCLGIKISGISYSPFYNVPIVTIDENALRGFLGTSIEYLFAKMLNVVLIPENLLMNTNIENAKSAFSGCISIKEVPLKLLANTKIVSASNMFNTCTGINTVVPEFWNLNDRTWLETNDCFYGCVNALNFSNIPIAWK